VYWRQKLKRNRERDRRILKELLAGGWSVLELWECEIRAREGLEKKLKTFLAG